MPSFLNQILTSPIYMKKNYFLFVSVFSLIVISACSPGNENPKPVFNPHPVADYLSPEESMKKIFLPDGYQIELVASEPMIKEPVAIAWDGNGRLYVAEMLTYMRDADATGEQQPISQIKMLEDTDGDGKMDKSTVFVDSLLLPRMIQTVGDELLVNETNAITITSYKDTDGDGKADVKKVIYKNDAYSTSDANMEHQRSGLDWNIDNWMYMTYEPIRIRYRNDKLEVDSIYNSGGQWGITHDNYGRLYYSSAGGETPVQDFQINPVYGKLNFKDNFDAAFQQVWPIMATPDVQGGPERLRPDNTLNHFTGCCGQSIYRGDALPEDLVGDYIVCEPVGRIIRRAKVEHKSGKTTLKNAYDSSEFIASQDMNFRPVNSATGPDGNLYIVDMHRGIIQQGNWTRPGTFLRDKIDSFGLAKNINRGRIYRVLYKGGKRSPKPNMLNETSEQLLQYLGHPNGWWRDNAQKLIVSRGDKSVVPELKNIATGQTTNTQNRDNHLARIHALWTLDGLDAMDKATLNRALNDEDARVRKTAVWMSEPRLVSGDTELINEVAKLKNDADYDVRVQVLLSMSRSDTDAAKEVVKEIVRQNAENEMIVSVKEAVDKNELSKNLSKRLGDMDKDDKRMVLNGAVTFRTFCANCHGNEGKGIVTTGQGMTAPPLTGARFVKLPEKDNAIRILLNGLKGPIEGKTYSGEMPAMNDNNDWWIASVLSYVRWEFNKEKNNGAKIIVKPDEVKKLREENKDRKNPWTEGELLKKR